MLSRHRSLQKGIKRPLLHQRVREIPQFFGMENRLVSQELQKRLAGSLSVGNHVKGELDSPVLRSGGRVADGGELLPRRQVAAAPSVVDDPLFDTVIQNKTEEAVELPGFLQRESGQVLVPSRVEDKLYHQLLNIEQYLHPYFSIKEQMVIIMHANNLQRFTGLEKLSQATRLQPKTTPVLIVKAVK